MLGLQAASCRAILLALMGLAIGSPALAQADAPEVERREAAAGFIHPQAMALSVLRRECRSLLPGDDGPDVIARRWWERNRDSLDASLWVIADAVRRYRAQGSAEQAALRERQMLQVFGDSMLIGLRTAFARQLPTAALCKLALERFRHKQLDVANLASTAGYEQFGEFGATLQRVLADPRYRPPDDKFRNFEAQVPAFSNTLLTHDAIEAAQNRGDGATVMRGYELLVAGGDAKAAMSLGVLHLNGRLAPRNVPLAAGWFYNAWAMGDAEGINALGVIWRDGLSGTPDKVLALAAFAMAQQMAGAGARQAQQRATANLTRLSAQVDAKVLAETGCRHWNAVHQAARQLASAAPGLSLAGPPTLPAGTLFDTAALDPTLRSDAAVCSN